MVAPFALLLLGIAVLPLLPLTEHWWESNLHRFYVAAALGAVTLLYYLVLHEIPVIAHWPAHHIASHNAVGLNFGATWAVLANAVFGEYIPFIMLLFSLYTISGGIRIEGDLPAHPLTNSAFIAAGSLLASFIGTTGAAMLLIRPLLETNAERRHVKHTVIFFIFVVCNCGGCLLPIGDPPLFLGYLRGVPFLWTFSLWPEWLFVNGLLICVYYLWDHFLAYPKEAIRDIAIDETRIRGLEFSGLWPNALLLLGVVLSVALLDPSKPLAGTDWHPWLYLREITQLVLVLVSLLLGSKAVRRANNFNYHAIIEVAALFFGIFICMQAPLQILHVRGPSLGLNTPMTFFWATGSLSSVLDNAPTYVVFFETARTLGITPAVAGVGESLLVGVSLGAVFLGAMTYIGNGPNFMVKAIAEKSGIRMPSFFGYMAYSCAILLPIFIVTTLIFLQ
jgi:Na+/H+ antiporter NhaD/arsenite permease-like protein